MALIYTKEMCLEESSKYETKKQWSQLSNGTYQAAKRNGWFQECVCGMNELKRNLSKNLCLNESLKHKSVADWVKADCSTYNYALKHGFLSECCSHMYKKLTYWTIELCKLEAAKYRSRYEWQRQSHKSYDAAHRNKWLNECCAHMEDFRSLSSPELEIMRYIKSHYPSAIKYRTPRIVDAQYPSLTRFEIDVYIPELRKGIEFNGDYWHGKGFSRKWTSDPAVYHKVKRYHIESYGIKYIEVKELEWNKDRSLCMKQINEFMGI